MDIKEIALKVTDSLRNKVDGISHMQSNQGLVAFAEALIESYKAELLKEVGEPVAVTNHAQLGYVTDGMHPDIPLAMWAKETSYSGANIALYTSDQVAAAILKATKALEKLLHNTSVQFDAAWRTATELRTQLAAAQEEGATVTSERDNLWFKLETAKAELADLRDQLAKTEQRVAEYNELIYAVQTKNPDETRHQTALRYIRNAENRPSNATANGASS